MIEFRRDKAGNLYSVRNGKIIGRIQSFGDGQEEQHGQSRRRENDQQRRSGKS